MSMHISGLVKLVLIVIVGLFLFKLASKWLAGKWSNPVTRAVDTVVQAA